jgi:Flp pilus assembly protein TadG
VIRRDERGVTVVEAAFVIPIIFLFALGLIDVGAWVFETGQASSAARDGARVGILRYGSGESGPDHDRIVTAVGARLPGQSGITVSVSCQLPDGAAVAGGCVNATEGRDRIRVDVAWDRAALTPVSGVFGTTQKVKATASMVIVGLPAVGP